MSDTVRPHSRQPTRLPRPWDSPGKNTGVGCHFLLQCMNVKRESEVTQSCPTLSDPWTTAYHAPPSMGFSRQEYWSGVPLPSPISGLVTDKREGDDDTFHCKDKWSIQFKAARLRGLNALPVILLEVWCPVHTRPQAQRNQVWNTPAQP